MDRGGVDQRKSQTERMRRGPSQFQRLLAYAERLIGITQHPQRETEGRKADDARVDKILVRQLAVDLEAIDRDCPLQALSGKLNLSLPEEGTRQSAMRHQ